MPQEIGTMELLDMAERDYWEWHDDSDEPDEVSHRLTYMFAWLRGIRTGKAIALNNLEKNDGTEN